MQSFQLYPLTGEALSTEFEMTVDASDAQGSDIQYKYFFMDADTNEETALTGGDAEAYISKSLPAGKILQLGL